MLEQRVLSCQCGQVRMLAKGAPILRVVCYCDDCQAAARQLADGGLGEPIADPDGGTRLVLFRQDRVVTQQGMEQLVPHKLRAGSPTNRVVARCCQTPMQINFDKGPHWVSFFERRVPGKLPPIYARMQTRFRTSELPLPDDAASYKTFPLMLIGRLIAAKIAMMVGR
jgi:hypothetical protein